MNVSQRIRHVTWFVVLPALLLLSLRVVYWPLVRGQVLQPVVMDPYVTQMQYGIRARQDGLAGATLQQLPRPVIQRTENALQYYSRGTLFDRNGQPLAWAGTTREEGVRQYSEPSMAHVVGYVSGYGIGVSGAEAHFNADLLGLDRLDQFWNTLVHRPTIGSDVVLTLDTPIQQAAARALGERPGAVVVLDAHSGAVLAMASAPAFDPNRLLRGEMVIGECALAGSCPSPLLNRATQGLYPPGSTWKIITTAAALEAGLAAPETEFEFGLPRSDEAGLYYVYEVDGALIEDRNHNEPVLSLTRSFALSANATFARLADEMGAETLLDMASRFGFDDETVLPIEVEVVRSQVANDTALLASNDQLRSVTGIGQGELLVSPLHMALVAAAIANGGTIPRPHLLLSIRDPNGDVLVPEPSADWRQALQPTTAQAIREMMIVAVQEGTGQRSAVSDLIVGGKTGTAETGGSQAPHAWFVGFAEQGDQAVAIAVLVENGGEGSLVAAPIFAEVASACRTYLGR